ncbi:MAG TPA: hypothetical protein VFN49_10170 [Candidatus Aquilonibacter sp.]|nr:hypothetical protein [Candidatus Aquilonibacter sp.]
MRPFLRPLFMSALLLFALAACHKGAQAVATPSLPPLMIDSRGIVLPLDEAVTKIDYRPWIPRNGQILKYAVIPPLGNKDTPENRGVAIEYENNHVAWLLSEWPKQNFTLLFLKGQDITFSPCTIAHYKTDGAAWTTHGKLAMTLQPDGDVPGKAVDAEARRLIAAGACR